MDKKLLDKIKKNPTLRKEIIKDSQDIAKNLVAVAAEKDKETKEIQKQIKNKGRKKFIEDSVTIYRSSFNAEYLDHCKYILKLRKAQANKYAASPDGEFRLLFKLPSRLYVYLSRFLEDKPFPENSKESKWFARKYPEFCVAEKL